MSYFSTDPFEQEESLNEIFKEFKMQMKEEINRIYNILMGTTKEIKEKYGKLSSAEKKKCDEFVSLFLTCPVCKGQNNRIDILSFYFNKSRSSKILKTKLINLMNKNGDSNTKIAIGIPCCDCFNVYFGDSKNT